MKHSLLFAVAFVTACATTAVFAREPLKAKSDPVAEKCAIVATRAADNVVSKWLIDATSVRIVEPIMHACMTAGRIMVRMTTVPRDAKVSRRLTSESGMFA